MKVGVFLNSTGPMLSGEDFAASAIAAEERGFESLWVSEHIVFFDDLQSTPPFSDKSSLVAGEYGIFDPFASLSFLASVTSRIRLGTGVALLTQRNPVQTAKLAATIDHLSGGRLDLGLGLGWVRQEFEALEALFEGRGRRADSYLRVMRSLWEEDPSQCETPDYELPAVRHWPKPVQQPLPVHVGGNSEGALRRAAQYGNGWYAFNLLPEALGERLAVLDAELSRAGRSRDELCISACGFHNPVDRDTMLRYRDAGVDRLILFSLDVGPDNREKRLDEYAETFLGAGSER